jgi:hypothetical protein
MAYCEVRPGTPERGEVTKHGPWLRNVRVTWPCRAVLGSPLSSRLIDPISMHMSLVYNMSTAVQAPQPPQPPFASTFLSSAASRSSASSFACASRIFTSR